MAYSAIAFTIIMTEMGFERTLIRKSRLKAGGRPLPTQGADSKVSVSTLPECEGIEAAIMKHPRLKLFSQPTIAEEDEE